MIGGERKREKGRRLEGKGERRNAMASQWRERFGERFGEILTEEVFFFVALDFFARAVGIRVGCFGGSAGSTGRKSVVETDERSADGSEDNVAVGFGLAVGFELTLNGARMSRRAWTQRFCMGVGGPYPYSLGIVMVEAMLAVD